MHVLDHLKYLNVRQEKLDLLSECLLRHRTSLAKKYVVMPKQINAAIIKTAM